MLRSVARTTSHLSNPVVAFAHNFFHRLRVSVWRYSSYYYYIFSESCAAVTTFSAGIRLLTTLFFFIAAVTLGIVFFFKFQKLYDFFRNISGIHFKKTSVSKFSFYNNLCCYCSCSHNITIISLFCFALFDIRRDDANKAL